MERDKNYYLEMYYWHRDLNERIKSESDIFEILACEETQERIARNERAMNHAKETLARYFKHFV